MGRVTVERLEADRRAQSIDEFEDLVDGQLGGVVAKCRHRVGIEAGACPIDGHMHGVAGDRDQKFGLSRTAQDLGDLAAALGGEELAKGETDRANPRRVDQRLL